RDEENQQKDDKPFAKRLSVSEPEHADDNSRYPGNKEQYLCCPLYFSEHSPRRAISPRPAGSTAWSNKMPSKNLIIRVQRRLLHCRPEADHTEILFFQDFADLAAEAVGGKRLFDECDI